MRLIQSKSHLQYLLTGGFVSPAAVTEQEVHLGEDFPCCFTLNSHLHPQLERQLPSSCPPRAL